MVINGLLFSIGIIATFAAAVFVAMIMVLIILKVFTVLSS